MTEAGHHLMNAHLLNDHQARVFCTDANRRFTDRVGGAPTPAAGRELSAPLTRALEAAQQSVMAGDIVGCSEACLAGVEETAFQAALFAGYRRRSARVVAAEVRNQEKDWQRQRIDLILRQGRDRETDSPGGRTRSEPDVGDACQAGKPPRATDGSPASGVAPAMGAVPPPRQGARGNGRAGRVQ